MITLDTSALFSALNSRDPHHERTMEIIRAERRALIVPVGILAEITYLIEQRLAQLTLHRFLDDLQHGRLVSDCGTEDIPRIRQLVARYADMPLGFADAAVIACAERRGGRVLTYDARHFSVVTNDASITVVN